MWIEVKDGDDRARGIMKHHYSWHEYKDKRPHVLFCGPGGKMVLLTQNCDALFLWRKFIDKSGQQGVNCAVFRNEGHTLSSILIKEAVNFARQRWPNERLYTYVNSKKIRCVSNPGKCFIKAGWRRLAEKTKGGLTILELVSSGGNHSKEGR